MKQSTRYIMIGLISVFFIAGCSTQPLQEINAAKALVDSIVSEGAEKYLPDDTKKINDDLNKAIDEIKAQDGKIFKNYGKAKEMLANVKAQAEAINMKLPSIKEEAKKEAVAAMEQARATIDAAKELSEKHPGKKNPNGEDETISSEIINLEDSLQELQIQIEREDYLTIASRATEIKSRAAELSSQIKQLPSKTDRKKK